MKYYRLNYNGTKWELLGKHYAKRDYKQIKLYDDNLQFIGIGLY